MKNLFKYLKHYYKSLLFILILLILQAICDLSLPTYTSDIINVGISQGGISADVPDVMRRSTMQSLTNLMSEEDKERVLESYSFVNNKYERYIKKYPILKDEAIYILNGEHDENLAELLKKPMLIMSVLTNNEMASLFANDLQLEEGVNLLEILKSKQSEVRNQIIASFDERIKNVPDAFVSSATLSFIKAEYQAVGMNIDHIQTNYILTTGTKMIAIALVSMFATVFVGLIGARMAAGLAKRLRTTVFD